MLLFDIFSIEGEAVALKNIENISGWYKYYNDGYGIEIDKFAWHFNLFAGVRLNPFIAGVTLGIGDTTYGLSLGFIMKVPLNWNEPSNIGTLYIKGFDSLNVAGSFRQYHRKD